MSANDARPEAASRAPSQPPRNTDTDRDSALDGKAVEMRAREAFVSWCESADYATDDPDAPHSVAFMAGFKAGDLRGDLAGTSQVPEAPKYLPSTCEVHGYGPPPPLPPEVRYPKRPRRLRGYVEGMTTMPMPRPPEDRWVAE